MPSKETIPELPTSPPIRLEADDYTAPFATDALAKIQAKKLDPPVYDGYQNTGRSPIRLVLYFLIVVSLLLAGFVWKIISDQKVQASLPSAPLPSNNPVIGTLETTADEPWTDQARQVLDQYIQQIEDEDLTGSRFVVRPLPESFQSRGIRLMYAQSRPLLENPFQPIVPVRVELRLDRPEFIDEAARAPYLKDVDRQNVCAFFKTTDDNQLVLDKPVFEQTRQQLLKKFIDRREVGKPEIFRLTIQPIPEVLRKQIYDRQLLGHDWYKIHCPAYPRAARVVCVPQASAAAVILNQRLATSEPDSLHAVTASLHWVETKPGTLTLKIDEIRCWEFEGLNNF
ncbi:hypothetical protein NT6N_23330 [Oceaniferula spumae]|uniref:Uncharacterized protein n=1 Tax=Oceaniferula spumae TaxID=2979115 RepID=A0AAT9FMW4_9BACT